MKKTYLAIALCSSVVLVPAMKEAEAAPGDVYRVNTAKVNLRAGASDKTQALSTVTPVDELIELRRDGSWIGVRVLSTGEEGWIYGELAEQITKSRLQEDTDVLAAEQLSPDFDQLLQQVENQLGYPMLTRLTQSESNGLRVALSHDWLRQASHEAHLMATIAFYHTWKTHNAGRSVELTLLDEQSEAYMAIRDEPNGPALWIASP